MRNRIVSLLLAAVMLLGFVPGGIFAVPAVRAAGTNAADMIKIDFKGLGQEVAEENWWGDLTMGSGAVNTEASADGAAQYENLICYLDENKDWTINEDASKVLSLNYPKKLFLNTDESKDWGLRIFSVWLGDTETLLDRNGIQIDLNVEKAGWYRMSVEAFLEKIGSTQSVDGFDSGSGQCMIEVNDQVIMEQRPLVGEDEVKVINAGFVELKEGINTITIHNTRDVFGNLGHSRRSICLNDITFQKVNSLKVDFMEFARNAAQQSWWSELRDTNVEGIKMVGDDYMSAPTEAEYAAFQQMQDYLAEEGIWNVTEGSPAYSDKYNGRELYINTSDDDYGIRFYPNILNAADDRDRLILTVEAPAAGLYHFDLSVLNEASQPKVAKVNGTMGRAYGSIYINDEPVYEDYGFQAATDSVVDVSFGAVELKKGTNTVTFEVLRDESGLMSTVRRAFNLRSMEFIPLNGAEVGLGRTLKLDLIKTYLQFDHVVSPATHTVSVANTAVAAAELQMDGTVLITGYQLGQTTLTVKKGSETVCTVPVYVVEPNIPEDGTHYTVDGFKAELLPYGSVGVGEVTHYENSIPMSEEEIREVGAVYFTSSDTDVAVVDQITGDVTPVGEGITTITAYILLDGMVTSDSVIITVTDDTDLASIDLYASVDYVGVGNTMQLHLSGKKASGANADLSAKSVAYSVDAPSVAALSGSKLTGLTAGTVTVTASIGVGGVEVTDTMDVEVVDNSRLEGDDILVDFTDGRTLQAPNATLEANGYELVMSECYDGGATLDYLAKAGISQKVPVGGKLAIDVDIHKDGWYWLEVTGGLFNYGSICNLVVDDNYMGRIDFSAGHGNSYGAYAQMNTVYLTAGTHRVVLTATKAGTTFLGKLHFRATGDPAPITVSLQPKNNAMLVGQSTEAVLTITDANGRAVHLQNVAAAPSYTNYFTLSSSKPGVVSVSGTTLTAKSAGTADLTASGKWLDQTISQKIAVTTYSGSINKLEVTADNTTVKPGAGPIQLTTKAYSTAGGQVSTGTVSYTSSNTAVASVSSTGLVSVGNTEGSAKITAAVTENGRTVTATIWITVTEGKTEPTIYTFDERLAAQENAVTYDWAIAMKDSAVSKADYYVEHLDEIYSLWIREGLPRCTKVGVQNTGDVFQYCRYCGEDLVSKYNVYPWIVDPIENPWKITCPSCKRDFPSNDFESYYKSGLDAQGYFHADQADAQYLVNELYPEKGAGWGVDDGFGYNSGNIPAGFTKEDVHTYIAYYVHAVFCSLGSSKHSMPVILDALREAYLYTGDEKYGNAGAILMDRLAEIYPEYKRSSFSSAYSNSDGNSGIFGKMVGCIWEAETIGTAMALAADAFWPCMENEEVVSYLKGKATFKGESASNITPESIRANVDEGILLQIKQACEDGDMSGNFGMQQSAIAYAAIALDRQPETDEMISWAFRYGDRVRKEDGTYGADGGAVMYHLIDLVDRDGFGNEVSYLYNHLWCLNMIDLADALEDYTGAEGTNLWQNPKFVNMFTAMIRATVCGRLMPQAGEAGFVQSTHNYTSAATMTTAFANTENREIAQALYAANGNTVEGLHADIFTPDPETALQKAVARIVEEDGQWDFSRSNMMSGFGIGILREGPAVYVKGENENDFFDYWMYFGKTGGGGHAQLEALNIDMEAFGLGLSSSMGYPLVVASGDPERMQWVRNTVSHNTVVVNDRGQSEMVYGGFPLHFEDAGKVKIMDAEASNAYPETDIYRRTLVTVAAENGVHYAVDFFRVLGGSEHVYSFHAAGDKMPKVEGLELIRQPMGTYAGPDIPFGEYREADTQDPSVNMGSGYSWLDNVSRDADPDTVFTVDFPIEDFQNHVPNSEGIRMKFTMLSDEPMTEVAIADGHPPQNGRNPEAIKYLLVRRSGKIGMDTLFTSIIEPYQGTELIASAQLLDVQLVEGEEAVTDRVAAMKITLTGGREDYVVYATNPDCLYSIKDTDGSEKFQFQGFTGVCSYKNGTLIYAHGSEVTTFGTGITEAQAKVTGRVQSFTEGIAETYTVTVTMDEAVTAEELEGRYIYVENDGERNAAYRIYGATVSGTTATLDLYTQTLVRGYKDKENMDLGYAHNIAQGNSYVIPLSAEATCPHTRNSVSYTSNDDGTHQVIRTCVLCKEVSSVSTAACKDGTDTNTLCDRCGFDVSTLACQHQNTTSKTVSNGDKTHTTTVTCQCGEVISTETADCADGTDADQLCDKCGFDLTPPCDHSNTTTEIMDNGDKTHTIIVTCQCGEGISIETEPCADGADEDQLCDKCGCDLTPPCNHSDTTETVTANADKTHTITVTCECGEVVSTETAQCADEDKDTKCDTCGAALVTITKFTMAGSNMTLGNELVVNVMFMKNKVTGTGNTIEITHGDAVTTIAQENWESYNAAMYVVRIPVAAKEMADSLTVTVKNADGYEIAAAYTTSVREYAMKVLAGSLTTYNQEMKNLAVDMLNYGAAAQLGFSYNTEDMANKLLTTEQAGWATADVTCTNNQVKGTNCMGSNLSLESKILLNIIFRLTETAAADKYAMVTYTDYTGKAVEYRVDTFNRFNASMQGVVVDEIVLADAFQLVTVTVYNTDGSVYGTGSDSVEGYAARTTNDLNAAIMKFASSAKTFLSK